MRPNKKKFIYYITYEYICPLIIFVYKFITIISTIHIDIKIKLKCLKFIIIYF